jgi:hypothetical protein
MKSSSRYAFLLCLVAGGLGPLGGLALGQSVKELGVGKASAFDIPGGERDPLWPIGWTPKPATASGAEKNALPEVAPKADAFYVSSISLDRIPLAVINGKAYGVGDHFVCTVGGGKAGPESFRLQVVAIRDGLVTLRYGTTDLACPLRIIQTAPSPKPTPSK